MTSIKLRPIGSARQALNSFLNFLFPSYCLLCDAPLGVGERIVCGRCWARLEIITDRFCPKCGALLRKGRAICASCSKAGYYFSFNRSLGPFDQRYQTLIHHLKYERMTSLAVRLGEKLLFLLRAEPRFSPAEGIVPVPLHPTKLRERGYNQSLLLAQEVSRGSGLPLIDDALQKVRRTKSQTRLTFEERVENLRGAFRVKLREKVEGKKLILIDDVFTTGSTLNNCAQALLEAGACEVYGLTLAIAKGS